MQTTIELLGEKKLTVEADIRDVMRKLERGSSLRFVEFEDGTTTYFINPEHVVRVQGVEPSGRIK